MTGYRITDVQFTKDCEMNIGYPVTGHKTDDWFTNAMPDIWKFVD